MAHLTQQEFRGGASPPTTFMSRIFGMALFIAALGVLGAQWTRVWRVFNACHPRDFDIVVCGGIIFMVSVIYRRTCLHLRRKLAV